MWTQPKNNTTDGQMADRRSSPRLRSCTTVAIALGCLSACSQDRPLGFSRTAADSLLDQLVAVHTRGAPTVTGTDPCEPDPDDGTSSMAQIVTQHLNSTGNLNFVCSGRRWETTIARDGEVWLGQGEDVVAWNRTPAWEDAVSIALFYDDEPRGDRTVMAPLAGQLEALRAFMTVDTLFDLPVVVSLSGTTSSPVPPSWSANLPHSTPQARFATSVSSLGDSIPPTPLATSRKPGWAIGVTSSQGAVTRAPDLMTAARPTVLDMPLVIEPSVAFRLHAEHWFDRSDTLLQTSVYYGQPFARALQSIPLPDDQHPWFMRSTCSPECWALLYWIAGIFLPIVFLAAVAHVVIIESSTKVEILRRQIAKLDSSRKRLKAKLCRKDDKSTELKRRPSITAASGPITRWRERRAQRRQRALQTTVRLTKKRLRETETKLDGVCRLWDDWKREMESAKKRLGDLASGTWETMLEEASGKSAAISLIVSMLAVIVSFSLLQNLADGIAIPILSEWPPIATALVATTIVYGAIMLAFMLVSAIWIPDYRGQVSRFQRIFAVGAAAVCSIGLNTIEAAPFATMGNQLSLNSLYDSQPVTVMFTCLFLLLSLQESIVHSQRETTRGEKWNSKGLPDSEAKSMLDSAKRREKCAIGVVGISYLLVVAYTFAPAFLEIVSGDQRTELLSVTGVGMVTALLPLLPLAGMTFGDGKVGKEGKDHKDEIDRIVSVRRAGETRGKEERR